MISNPYCKIASTLTLSDIKLLFSLQFGSSNMLLVPIAGAVDLEDQEKLNTKRKFVDFKDRGIADPKLGVVSHSFTALRLSPSGRTWRRCTRHKTHEKSVSDVVYDALFASFTECM